MPSRVLSFVSVPPQTQNSASFLPQPPFMSQRKCSVAKTSASTSSSIKKRKGGTHSSVASTSLSGKKRREGTLSSAEDDDEDHSIGKDDKDIDYVPVTNQAVNDIMEGKDGGELAAIIANHCNVFMKRAFPPGEEQAYSIQTRSLSRLNSLQGQELLLIVPSLTIDLMWLIIKSKQGSGFQSWHRDFYLETSKITKTVVINLGVMKRNDLLGGPFCVFINSDKKGNSDNEGNVGAAKGNDSKPSHKVCPNNADYTDDHDNLPSDNWDSTWVWDTDFDQ